MFDIQSLQSNSENPTFMSIFLSVVVSVVLSSLLLLIYDLTTKPIERSNHYMQSLVLISIVATMVMQAVGDSLARGLGMLGALAIIRFRTTLRDPRHMTFMFCSLAIGISCGVSGFTIAITGVLAFSTMALVLRFTPFGALDSLTGQLKINLLESDNNLNELESLIGKYVKGYELVQYRVKDQKLFEEIKDIPPVANNPTGPINPKPIKKIIGYEQVRELDYKIKVNKGQDKLLYKALEELATVKDFRLRFNKEEQVI